MATQSTRTGGDPTPALPRNTILLGDVRERLRQLPSASVDCVVTSPPYFHVRNYGHHKQLGAEPTVNEWVGQLRSVCAELARVLRPNGALWLNLGDVYSQHPNDGALRKSLLLGPARVAMALLADGWILRNQVIWAKSNPMPSSVTDRLSTTHEMVYFFTLRRQYYFDLDAIRQPLKTTARQSTTDPHRTYPPAEARQTRRVVNGNSGLSQLKARGVAGHPLGKNPGDVWRTATASFRGGHFAVFPAELIEKPLLATCPERTCSACGASWRRQHQTREQRLLAVGSLQPSCACAAAWLPGVVLDPFFGTGTVALAAEKLRRDWIGIEINEDYVQLANQRIAQWRQDPSSARS